MAYEHTELLITRKLVQKQLEAQHIEESTSPWNSPIKKKSAKWRMLTDLRIMNRVIQLMAQLQPGIPLQSLLPKSWPVIVIDLIFF